LIEFRQSETDNLFTSLNGMQITPHTHHFATTGQMTPEDLKEVAKLGFRSIICNRPDCEGGTDQPASEAIRAAAHRLDIEFAYLPVRPDAISDKDVQHFAHLLDNLPAPILAFCRTGNRSTKLYQKASACASRSECATRCPDMTADVVVIGGGSAGIGIVASLLKRAPDMQITLIEPNDNHYYQPAWTLVGGGAYDVRKTVRPMSRVIPRGATWIKAAVVGVLPGGKRLELSNGKSIAYQHLIVCPGLRLAWEKIEGLEETLGKNGVTSNYRYDLCAYTWQLVQGLRQGKALFSQPGMPIKCAGAPQKALYLSCDHWQKSGALQGIEVEFNLAGTALFGVAAFVPPLMNYIKKYQARLVFGSNLVKVDGPNRTAWFESQDEHGTLTRHAKTFDMLHVVPAQVAPDFIRTSPLADAAGWCEVDPETLQHIRYPQVFALGDVCSTSNAKTAAAARKQIVVVAENLLAVRDNKPLPLRYDGYGSCPLTVEKGKVVLAEFGYGGKLLPTFPLDATVARKSAWFLKARFLPWFYWNGMLKGREWLTSLSKAR
jgi:sulfide:quinone oxidoreductase